MRILAALQRGFIFALATTLLILGRQNTSSGQGGRKIYWTEWNRETRAGKIQRANLDGSRVKEVITGLGYPWGIALEIPGAYAVNHGVDTLTTIWAKMKVE